MGEGILRTSLLMLAVPLIGLTVTNAPGFAHYLEFLRPVANSNGFGAGVLQGLVPAIALPLMIGLAVCAIDRQYII